MWESRAWDPDLKMLLKVDLKYILQTKALAATLERNSMYFFNKIILYIKIYGVEFLPALYLIKVWFIDISLKLKGRTYRLWLKLQDKSLKSFKKEQADGKIIIIINIVKLFVATVY